jgi:imidazolonepropionase
MLKVIRRLKENSDMTIKATFLGAHAVPTAYKNNRATYIRTVTHEMLPRIAQEGLADFIDVFCEKLAFSAEETNLILEAGAKWGLRPKIHTNQFHSIGGIETALQYEALSVDHLEVLTDYEIDLLSESNTVATLLPTAPFFLNDPHTPPARQLIDSGSVVALATDFNPGTSPSVKMPFVWSLACIRLRMLPEEALNATTFNGAYAMSLADKMGSIEIGKYANLILTKPIPSLAYLPYSFGNDWIARVWVKGK